MGGLKWTKKGRRLWRGHDWTSPAASFHSFTCDAYGWVHPVGVEFHVAVTHVVSPGDLVGSRTRPDGAFEVDVVALLDVGPVQVGPQRQGGARHI